MRIPAGTSFILIIAFLLTPGLATASGRALARVDGEEIRDEDLERIFQGQHMGHDSFLVGESEVRAALDRMIDRVLLLQEAERMDLGSRPEIQRRARELERNLAVQHLVKVEIEDPAEPTEEQIRSAYERFTGHFLIVRQIVVPERAEIEEIAALLADDEDFAELARSRSRVRSSQAGGLLPPMGWGAMEEAWDRVAFGLEPGEISEPFASGGAWEILLLEEIRPVEKPDFEAARGKLEGILLKRGLEARERAFSEELHRKYEVEVKVASLTPEACAVLLASDPEAIVASWNDGELTIGELAERGPFEALADLTPRQGVREVQERLRTSVTRALLRLEAEARKLAERPEIQAEGLKLRQEAMLAALHNQYIFKDLAVTEDEVKGWYEKNQSEVRVPEKRFVSQIVVSTEEAARAAAARLEEGVPFADLARELSLDAASAEKGGALGWISRDESPPGFEAVFSLPQGGVAEPVETGIGWHLIRVLEIQPERALSLEEARERITTYLDKKSREGRLQEWLTQLRAAAEIEIDEQAVRRYAADRGEPR